MTQTDRLTELMADACALQARTSAQIDPEALLAEAALLRSQLCATAGEVEDRILAADAEGAVCELEAFMAAVSAASERLLRASA